eukprot:CAMPEP_0116935674 /NCGR_PEP_ID=MMETSP0467-20121206/30430_1 /TAXON_ID=283647 /ORGANISM="Mesodinium pulex, Strain SPMC105" /LENGTH=88 /DNA_ID=CAMNT_0004617105 /DNA_START=680 /DNA_END=943 /DNA_ORIENTATION=-
MVKKLRIKLGINATQGVLLQKRLQLKTLLDIVKWFQEFANERGLEEGIAHLQYILEAAQSVTDSSAYSSTYAFRRTCHSLQSTKIVEP